MSRVLGNSMQQNDFTDTDHVACNNNRLENALAESKEQGGKYEASHPNLRKLDTSGKQ